MKSERPKVLHELCGRPMLWYVVRSLRESGVDEIIVVSNPELDPQIAQFGVQSIIQAEQLGTGHAVQIALAALPEISGGRLVVAYGDMPLIASQIFRDALDVLNGSDGARTALAMVTARMPLPSNFGRVVRDGADVKRIVEAKDADPNELAIGEMNAGVYAFDEGELRTSLSRLRNDNVQREYYLTDTVELLVKAGKRVAPVLTEDHVPLLGINDRVELALARKELNARLCKQYMRVGVTIIDPQVTYLEPELKLGRDTILYPNTTVGRLSEIGEQCVIGPNARISNAKLGNKVTVRESVIVDSTLGDNVTVGPFAHLRGETKLANDVKIGNFVEVKNSKLARGVKASHLTYLGDAEIGEESNIGCGTVTCNYDGEKKNKTIIGKNVMIGSNSSLVAPVTIGDGALTGASSVVTRDIAPGERVAGNPARPLPKKD